MPISNMPVATTEKRPGGLQRVQFARSPKMSTYLLFFGVGDFERVHRMVQGVDVGIVVKRGDTAIAAYALDATAELYGGRPPVDSPLTSSISLSTRNCSTISETVERCSAVSWAISAREIGPRSRT